MLYCTHDKEGEGKMKQMMLVQLLSDVSDLNNDCGNINKEYHAKWISMSEAEYEKFLEVYRALDHIENLLFDLTNE